MGNRSISQAHRHQLALWRHHHYNFTGSCITVQERIKRENYRYLREIWLNPIPFFLFGESQNQVWFIKNEELTKFNVNVSVMRNREICPFTLNLYCQKEKELYEKHIIYLQLIIFDSFRIICMMITKPSRCSYQ